MEPRESEPRPSRRPKPPSRFWRWSFRIAEGLFALLGLITTVVAFYATASISASEARNRLDAYSSDISVQNNWILPITKVELWCGHPWQRRSKLPNGQMGDWKFGRWMLVQSRGFPILGPGAEFSGQCPPPAVFHAEVEGEWHWIAPSAGALRLSVRFRPMFLPLELKEDYLFCPRTQPDGLTYWVKHSPLVSESTDPFQLCKEKSPLDRMDK